jgi:hypothetical protein
MQLKFFSSLLIFALLAGTYWYGSTRAVCPTPLLYKVGTLDGHFAISKEEAIAHLAKAEVAWEENAGRELFVYDENANFTVDFVFDDRQAVADNAANRSVALDAQKAKNEELYNTIAELEQKYKELSTIYESRVSSYEERLKQYNQTVRRYNDQGGAPAEEFEKLQTEQKSLDVEASELSSQAGEMNTLASEINTLGTQSNELIEAYNRQVQQFNKDFGYSREFTQGDYTGSNINIYKFSNTAELVTVLTHEFGHALGIDHVEGEGSVMYYLLTDESEHPSLSEEDVVAFMATCGTGNELSHTIRRVIRETLAKFI